MKTMTARTKKPRHRQQPAPVEPPPVVIGAPADNMNLVEPAQHDVKDSAQTSEVESKGIECPRCGCRHLPVDYTRPIHGGRMRVRYCRNCGRRVITREKIQ